ncbi:MAG: chemotaxis protein CheW [Aureispira sp.]
MAEKKQYTLDDVRREAANYKEQQAPTELLQLVVFKLGGESYGLAIDQIKEVVLSPPVARMPQTPAYIKGLANIRGNIIAIMDLEQKFGLQEQDTTINAFPYTLVIENETYKIGVLVKNVPDTITVPVEDIDRASDFVQYSSLDARCLVGVVTAKDRLIILIDIIKMVEVEGIETAY